MEKLADRLSQYILKKSKKRVKYNLDQIKKVSDYIGNPSSFYKIIHVAGTNGKGSTANMIAKILETAGYKVGLFTSPHVLRWRERISINSKQISNKQARMLADFIFRSAEKQKLKLSFFEATTLIALQFFKEQKIDYAVIEVGLGGRLDATNIVNGKINVITNIDLDHTKILGKNQRSIAQEKAGIIKHNSIVITGATGDALFEIQKVCKQKNAKLFTLEKIARKRINNSFKIISEQIYLLQPKYLYADYQLDNMALAVLVSEKLGINKSFIEKGIYLAKNIGRFQVISKNPILLIDGAHNPAGISALLNSLSKFKFTRLIVVMGVMKDKDIDTMLKQMHCDIFIATSCSFDRALSSTDLFNKASLIFDEKTKTYNISDPKQAVSFAKSISNPQDLICVCGSLYLLGDTGLIS